MTTFAYHSIFYLFYGDGYWHKILPILQGQEVSDCPRKLAPADRGGARQEQLIRALTQTHVDRILLDFISRAGKSVSFRSCLCCQRQISDHMAAPPSPCHAALLGEYKLTSESEQIYFSSNTCQKKCFSSHVLVVQW